LFRFFQNGAMHLSVHDFRQLDEEILGKLTPEQARMMRSRRALRPDLGYAQAGQTPGATQGRARSQANPDTGGG
jgi:hypothetical protein